MLCSLLTDKHTGMTAKTEDTLSGFQDFFFNMSSKNQSNTKYETNFGIQWLIECKPSKLCNYVREILEQSLTEKCCTEPNLLLLRYSTHLWKTCLMFRTKSGLLEISESLSKMAATESRITGSQQHTSTCGCFDDYISKSLCNLMSQCIQWN